MAESSFQMARLCGLRTSTTTSMTSSDRQEDRDPVPEVVADEDE